MIHGREHAHRVHSALVTRPVPRFLVQPEPVLHDAVQIASRHIRPLVGPVEVGLKPEPVHVTGHDLEAEPGRGKAGEPSLPVVTRMGGGAMGRRSAEVNAAGTAAAGRAADAVAGTLEGRWGAVDLRSGLLEEMATVGDVVDVR